MTLGRPVGFHPAAMEEVGAACRWYAERNPLAALAFAAELEQATREIADHPTRWPA